MGGLMTNLYLFRHGETDWNKNRRFQGHTDIPLNDLGRTQAQELASLLSPLPLHAMLTSDLKRAKETADIVNTVLKIPMYESQDLRECSLGDPEGMYRDKIVEEYGAPAWERWLSIKREDQDFGFRNGETKNQHLRRLLAYLETFCEMNPHFRTIAVSSHGGSLRRLVHHCEGAPDEAIPLPNCAVYQITYEHDTGLWKYVGAKGNDGDSNVWAKSS
jgi:probable phosphoglycerate mutase